ncbi:MAG: D-alanyl-D-alanine carboxypeptidase family protein [Clostridia bacterium]|nr:D-alanyl-D-alanine carboxypeptidase family protein [Clostridia bacterium]
MKRRVCAALVILLLGICQTFYVRAEVSAHSAILTEMESGRVIYAKSASERLPMASTTKIITAVCALESEGADMNREVEISAAAAGVEGSSMYLQQGERMTLGDLLHGLMLSSGNDAAIAVAETISGDTAAFVEKMNELAARLGANDTHLTNPNGLPDDNHYSTAADMARITAYALKNPSFAELAACKSYRIDREGVAYPRVLKNHNRLLSMYDGCIGVKTGFTKAAGRCLVSAAKRDGMTLICVTLNAPDDWNDHMTLLDFGFENYALKRLSDTKEVICSAEIGGTDGESVPVCPGEDFYYPVKSGESVNKEVNIYPEPTAPLDAGERLGEMKISVTDSGTGAEVISKTVPLVSARGVELPVTDCRGESLTDRIRYFFTVWMGMVINSE